jgi:hypothetical protein
MPADATTFFWSFATLFAALGYFLWRMEKQLRQLEQRVRLSEMDPMPGPAIYGAVPKVAAPNQRRVGHVPEPPGAELLK